MFKCYECGSEDICGYEESEDYSEWYYLCKGCIVKGHEEQENESINTSYIPSSDTVFKWAMFILFVALTMLIVPHIVPYIMKFLGG